LTPLEEESQGHGMPLAITSASSIRVADPLISAS
jgi:hypothetical protein